MTINGHNKTTARFLRHVPLFRSLTGGDFRHLSRIARVRQVKKGEMIFSKAAWGDTLYVVVKGMVKIFSKSRMGKLKTFAYLAPREFFGEMAILDKAERSAGAMAVRPATLLTVRRADFQALLKSRPPLALALLRALSERLRRADTEIELLSFNTVVGRLAQILLDMAKRHGRKTPRGVRIGLDLSHQELAEMAGTAREMVSRVLHRFERTGCLSTEGGAFTITNPRMLRDWII